MFRMILGYFRHSHPLEGLHLPKACPLCPLQPSIRRFKVSRAYGLRDQDAEGAGIGEDAIEFHLLQPLLSLLRPSGAQHGVVHGLFSSRFKPFEAYKVTELWTTLGRIWPRAAWNQALVATAWL